MFSGHKCPKCGTEEQGVSPADKMRPTDVSTRAPQTCQPVEITGIDIPIWNLALFMIKLTVAAIPAAILVGFVWWGAYSIATSKTSYSSYSNSAWLQSQYSRSSQDQPKQEQATKTPPPPTPEEDPAVVLARAREKAARGEALSGSEWTALHRADPKNKALGVGR